MLPISLDHTSGVPIYVQLKDAIRTAVRTGAFRQGTQLPTVRQMAVELKINANTVSRAYMELELDYQNLAAMEEMIEELLVQAAKIGFSVEDVLAVLETKRRVQRQLEDQEV